MARQGWLLLLLSLLLMASVGAEGLLDEASAPDESCPEDKYRTYEDASCKDANTEIVRDIDDLELCQRECDCNDWCVGFTWNSERGDCYLKSICAERQDADGNGDISGVRTSAIKYSNNRGKKCKGTRIKRRVGGSAKNCRKRCTNNWECEAWAFNELNSKCELLTGCKELLDNEDFTSGWRRHTRSIRFCEEEVDPVS